VFNKNIKPEKTGGKMVEAKKLYRSQKEKMIAGVCSGIADYFDIDPTLVRLIFIVFTFIKGAGVLIYIIMAIIVPVEPEEKVEVDRKEKAKEFADDIAAGAKSLAEDLSESAKTFAGEMKEKGWLEEKRNIFGLILILISLIVLSEQLFPLIFFNTTVFWAILLFFLGLYIILRRK
jgi:phage shock protein C